MRILVAFASLAIITCLPLNAQPGTFGESWRWVHFTEADGLLANLVYDVVESSAGTPWATTLAGLAWPGTTAITGIRSIQPSDCPKPTPPAFFPTIAAVSTCSAEMSSTRETNAAFSA
jgi:hypothetical protein